MADVMSHEGDGVGDPPHQPPHRLHSSYESEVSEEQQTRLRSIIEIYFDFQDDQSLDEYQVVCAIVDRLTVDRYRDYKFKAHNHVKEHRPSCLYDELFFEEL
ncbi:hypothetical protein Adt_30902 [Abeliophyllum distichum]|uniref:Uncharacterized protein n=1 Tax=Abeliophyllum distichum TaxID=126358 RepID=A0ABD1RDZ1_9LAMI